jgi:hypothetical protein
MRLVLTAGFDRALHAIALAELVTRDGHEIACVLVVDPFRVARLRAWLRRHGRAALMRAARRLAGRPAGGSDARMLEFLAKNGVEQLSLGIHVLDAVAELDVDAVMPQCFHVLPR